MAVSDPTTEVMVQQVIDKFWESVPPVWNRIRTNLRTIAAEQFDISVEQFHILRHIRKGAHSVSELAEIKQISRSAISQTVDLLVEKGLISRQQTAEDRRCVRLELTEAGNDMLNTIFQQNREWMTQKLTGLSEPEMDMVILSMEILKRTFIDA